MHRAPSSPPWRVGQGEQQRVGALAADRLAQRQRLRRRRQVDDAGVLGIARASHHPGRLEFGDDARQHGRVEALFSREVREPHRPGARYRHQTSRWLEERSFCAWVSRRLRLSRPSATRRCLARAVAPSRSALSWRRTYGQSISSCLPASNYFSHDRPSPPSSTVGTTKGGTMNRVELETKLNEGRNWLLAKYQALSDEQLHRPLTTSEHDPENRWTALTTSPTWRWSNATSTPW